MIVGATRPGGAVTPVAAAAYRARSGDALQSSLAREGGPVNSWKTALGEGVVAGTAASILSTAVLATAGLRQAGSAVAPTNAVSH